MLSFRTRASGFCAFCAALAGLVSFAACSSSQNRSGFQEGDGGTSPAGDGGVFAPTDGAAVDENGCTDAAKLVYVLSYEGDLYSFAPTAKKFTKIGPLGCNLGAMQVPISMAVDRKGVAWVNIAAAGAGGSRNNTLYKVDTATAACTKTNITSGYIGGMGFSTNQGTKDEETLFVFGQSGSGSSPVKTLDHVDFAKETIVTGPTVMSGAGELTGTGDGRLYGFVLHEPQIDQVSGKPKLDNLLAITELDKTTGKDSGEVVLNGAKFPHDPGFAFSFYGGDFYVYSAPITIPPDYPLTQPPADLKDEPTTDVVHYSPANKTTDPSYMKAIGFHIVGAGVSTCAPTTGVR